MSKQSNSLFYKSPVDSNRCARCAVVGNTVKAISPKGNLHDVKGVKISEERIEMVFHGVEIFAHIKALPVVVESKN